MTSLTQVDLEWHRFDFDQLMLKTLTLDDRVMLEELGLSSKASSREPTRDKSKAGRREEGLQIGPTIQASSPHSINLVQSLIIRATDEYQTTGNPRVLDMIMGEVHLIGSLSARDVETLHEWLRLQRPCPLLRIVLYLAFRVHKLWARLAPCPTANNLRKAQAVHYVYGCHLKHLLLRDEIFVDALSHKSIKRTRHLIPWPLLLRPRMVHVPGLYCKLVVDIINGSQFMEYPSEEAALRALPTLLKGLSEAALLDDAYPLIWEGLKTKDMFVNGWLASGRFGQLYGTIVDQYPPPASLVPKHGRGIGRSTMLSPSDLLRHLWIGKLFTRDGIKVDTAVGMRLASLPVADRLTALLVLNYRLQIHHIAVGELSQEQLQSIVSLINLVLDSYDKWRPHRNELSLQERLARLATLPATECLSLWLTLNYCELLRPTLRNLTNVANEGNLAVALRFLGDEPLAINEAAVQNLDSPLAHEVIGMLMKQGALDIKSNNSPGGSRTVTMVIPRQAGELDGASRWSILRLFLHVKFHLPFWAMTDESVPLSAMLNNDKWSHLASRWYALYAAETGRTPAAFHFTFE